MLLKQVLLCNVLLNVLDFELAGTNNSSRSKCNDIFPEDKSILIINS